MFFLLNKNINDILIFFLVIRKDQKRTFALYLMCKKSV